MESNILVQYPKFFSKQWCDFLIGLASTKLEEAGTVGEEIEGYRVANSCWLGDIDSPYLDEIKRLYIVKTTSFTKINLLELKEKLEEHFHNILSLKLHQEDSSHTSSKKHVFF